MRLVFKVEFLDGEVAEYPTSTAAMYDFMKEYRKRYGEQYDAKRSQEQDDALRDDMLFAWCIARRLGAVPDFDQWFNTVADYAAVPLLPKATTRTGSPSRQRKQRS